MQSFQLSSRLEPEQAQFLIEGLQRSGLFQSLTLDDQEFRFSLKNQVQPSEAKEAFDKLLAIAMRRVVDRIFTSDFKRPPETGISVTQALIDKGMVVRLAPGYFTFQGDFLHLMNWLDLQVTDWALTLGSHEQQYPVVWPIDLYKKINYLHDFPQNILMVAGVRKQNENLKRFANEHRSTNDYEAVELSSDIAPITRALGSSTCDTCYYAFRSGILKGDRVYHAKSRCFRNEASASQELDRLHEFNMREVIVIGSEAKVMAMREEFISFSKKFVNQLELPGRIETANDPFFTNQAILKTLFQDSAKAKYEVVAETGGKTGDIAVGSINWHGDQFGRAFEVSYDGGGLMKSGCIGFGLERLAFAFCTQHGIDRKHWPSHIRDQMPRV